MIGFQPPLLPDHAFDNARGLRAMCLKGTDLLFNEIVDIQNRAGRRRAEAPPSGELERGSQVIQPLHLVRFDICRQLLPKAIIASRPVKCKRGKHRRHCVVAVSCGAVRRKSDQHLGTDTANPENEIGNGTGRWNLNQSSVGISEYLSIMDLQNVTSGGKFGTANLTEFLSGFRAASATRFACSERDHGGFDSAGLIQKQGAAESRCFIVGMCRNAE